MKTWVPERTFVRLFGLRSATNKVICRLRFLRKRATHGPAPAIRSRSLWTERSILTASILYGRLVGVLEVNELQS
jgi:hypothetical protein